MKTYCNIIIDRLVHLFGWFEIFIQHCHHHYTKSPAPACHLRCSLSEGLLDRYGLMEKQAEVEADCKTSRNIIMNYLTLFCSLDNL